MASKFKIYAVTLLSCIICPLVSVAQESYPCGTYQFMEELMEKDPEYSRQIANYSERISQLNNSANLRQQQTTKIIPVVVHVIYNTAASNISDAQVYNAIEVLNKDFNKLNADTNDIINAFRPIAANVGVQFKLARLNPEGHCSNGITRTNSALSNSAGENVKDLIRWPSSKYLNIWVVRNIASGAGGYSMLPCAPASADGIVIRNDQFGTIGTSSPWGLAARSLTHEVGHYLGLPHTWGHSNNPGLASNCDLDDGISDTPNTVGVSNGGCNTNAISCAVLNNVQNFMDYSNCPKMFTEGQKTVIMNALDLSCRTNLWSAGNLIATGTNSGFQISSCTPNADFEADITRICQGDVIYFEDMSEDFPQNPNSGRLWTFDGGLPSTSTDPDPVVQYNNPGNYTVKLEVTNPGGTTTVEKTAFIRVISTAPLLLLPIEESFENPAFPNISPNAEQNWELQSSTTNTWHRTTLASAHANSSFRILNQYIPQSRENSLTTPNIDLTGIANPVLRFKRAYALPANSTSGSDRLRVIYSPDCGKNWFTLFNQSGSSLATTTSTVNNFVPGQHDWLEEQINLTFSHPYVMISFESVSGNANALYLDAIRITDGVTGINPTDSFAGLTVYPNPGDGNSIVSYHLPHDQKTELTLLNTLGVQVLKLNRNELAGLKQYAILPPGVKIPSGVYFLRLSTEFKTYTEKIILN